MNKEMLIKCSHWLWYPSLANYTFPTSFVKLREEEIAALADGKTEGKEIKGVLARMALPMQFFPGNCFVFTDVVAPTDTKRYAGKRGAVYSPKSAWRYLAESEKTRRMATQALVTHIGIRPFRRMNRSREFRLFIYKGELKAMSQYWLLRHYHRLERDKEKYWRQARKLVQELSWNLPLETVVLDIYFTSDGRILLIDFNPWGEATDPLLLKDWQLNWQDEIGIKTIPPPTRISGKVNVSF